MDASVQTAADAAVTLAGGVTPHPGAVPLSPSQIFAGLTDDVWWPAGQFTFSIPTVGAAWPSYDPGTEPDVRFSGFSLAQAARFRAALASWDKLIAPNFTETNDASSPGNIRVGFSGYSDLNTYWGYTYFPPVEGGTGLAYYGDIWVNAKYRTSDFFDNGYDDNALIHELGHALGLKHPFEDPTLPAAYDSVRYTVMSYTDNVDLDALIFAPTAGGGLAYAYKDIYSTTPMVLDIAAVQAIYGADPTTAAGDDTYTFAGSRPFMFSIYDAGGNDTIDVSGMAHGSVVDLTPGAYSSIGYYSADAQKADAIARYGPYFADFITAAFTDDPTPYSFADNLGIAFSTVIENAIGGPHDDTLIGNLVANRLTGGAGNDILTGAGGDDTIDGGAGLDTAVFSGASSDYSWAQTSTGWTVRDLRSGSPDGTDTLINVEQLRFSDRTVDIAPATVVIGTIAADTLTGTAGNDAIYGQGGDDRLTADAGDDLLDGGAGTDVVFYASKASDHAWWSNPDGTWTVKDLRPGSPDGTDTLRDVEAISFTDRTITIAGGSTADIVNAAFQNVMMYAPTTAADTSFVTGIVSDVVSGAETLAQGIAKIVAKADATSAVASIAYEFFTGAAPSKGGFDYLVDPSGPNPNNLNSAYYQSFSLENRYINFAVNLGKLGDGKAQFAAQYGALSLFDATKAAYTVIFGGAPTDDKVHAILDTTVQSGGQILSRAGYFALYGQDGANGIGTKAAMVGWLLTEAVKADLGTYALADNAYLTDLADGAPYGLDVVQAYGQPQFVYPGDLVVPTLLASTPADNASAVAVNANIVLTFSEAVKAGQGAIEIMRVSDGKVLSLVSIDDPDQIAISGATVTINLATDLPANANIYVNMPSGVITDLAGNAYGGVTGKTALNFSTNNSVAAAGVGDLVHDMPGAALVGAAAEASLLG